MSGWRTVKLGELGTLRNGLNFGAEARGRGLAIVGVRDFQDHSFVRFEDLEQLDPSALGSADALIRQNDILFVRSNGNRELIGRSLLVKDQPPTATSHSGFTIRFRLQDSGAHPPFFAYLLRGGIVRRLLSQQGGGTNINNLNQGILAALDLAYPPLKIQRRIAAILGAYDDLIEVNRQRVVLLETMARSLFEEWFVRFRFPGHENVAMVDTPVGPLPYGWTVQSLGQNVQNFDRHRRPLSGAQRALKQGQYAYYGAAKIFDYIDDFIFDGLHVLMAEDGSVITPDGFPILQLADGRFWVNNHAHILRGKYTVSTEYLYFSLQRHPVQGYITGAAQPKITQANLNRIPIVIGNDETMLRFGEISSNIVGQMLSLRRANRTLAASRDLLLPRLMSGQLSVAAAERELLDAA